MLATVARIAGEVLTRCGGKVNNVVSFLGGKPLAPHVDEDRTVERISKRHGLPDMGRLEHIARVGVSVDEEPGGDLEKEITCGNHSSATEFKDEVRGDAIADLVRDRALVCPLE